MHLEESAEEKTPEQLGQLARFLGRFEAAGASAGHLVEPPAAAEGTLAMPWFEFSTLLDEFQDMLYEAGWIEGFDWPAWITTEEARALRDDPSVLARATAGQLGKLLTAIFRQERFSEGTVEATFGSGLLVGILRRAADLAAGEA